MLTKFWTIFTVIFGTTLFVQADALPLEGRKFGVEINIPRLLVYSDFWKSATGTFSRFDYENRAEIALPWEISTYTKTDYNDPEIHMDIINVDLHYRKFLGEALGGFYLSGFGRVSFLNGMLDKEEVYKKTTKFGLGVGLGYRYFPKKERYYWGAGLIVGRYITGEHHIYRHIDFYLEDSSIITDIEFLKFGYAF